MSAVAQSAGFTAGKIVTLNGDTLSGQVYDYDWSTGPTAIRFVDNVGLEQQLTPATVMHFYVARRNEWWTSRAFSFSEVMPARKGYEQTDVRNVKLTAFLKVLFASSLVRLYEHTDQYGQPHFMLEKDGDFVELINYELVMKRRSTVSGQPADETNYLVKYEYYKAQLVNFFADCQAYTVPKLLAYDAITLVNVMGGYCSARQGTTYRSMASSPVSIQVLLGLSRMSTTNAFDKQVGYTGGHVYMRINNNRKFGRSYAALGYTRMYKSQFFVDYYSVQGGYKLTPNRVALFQPYLEGGVCTVAFEGDRIPISLQIGAGVAIGRYAYLSVQKIGLVDNTYTLQLSAAFGRGK